MNELKVGDHVLAWDTGIKRRAVKGVLHKINYWAVNIRYEVIINNKVIPFQNAKLINTDK